MQLNEIGSIEFWLPEKENNHMEKKRKKVLNEIVITEDQLLVY